MQQWIGQGLILAESEAILKAVDGLILAECEAMHKAVEGLILAECEASIRFFKDVDGPIHAEFEAIRYVRFFNL